MKVVSDVVLVDPNTFYFLMEAHRAGLEIPRPEQGAPNFLPMRGEVTGRFLAVAGGPVYSEFIPHEDKSNAK